MKRFIQAGATIVAAIAVLAGCGSNGGGTGGGGSSSTSSSSSSSSSGHATGGGGTGGASSGCVDGAGFADLFAVADPAFCAVATYEAAESLIAPSMVPQAPSWGAHGGPLWFMPDATGGGVTIERWTPPAGPSGMLSKTKSTHVAAMIPDGAFPGAQALDTPFFGWTAISWTNAFPDTTGKVVMIDGGAVGHTYDVNGVFALGAVGDANGGRLLFTGLSPLGTTTAGANGFYAADACSMPSPDLGAGTGCSASAEVAAWGDSSGPVAVDADGNAFVVLASFAVGNQEARGFAAAEVAKGAQATAGATLFTLPGFGSSLAAIAPRAGKAGVLVFQPFDMNATPLDVVAMAYAAGSAITPMGAPAKLLTVAASTPPSLMLMSDAANRLWVVATEKTKTRFVVIDRKP